MYHFMCVQIYLKLYHHHFVTMLGDLIEKI